MLRFVLLTGVLTLQLAASAVGQTPPAFPPAQGPYPVGTQGFVLVDEARLERSSVERGTPRRIGLQLWYPTEVTQGADLAPYIPGRVDMAADGDPYFDAVPEMELGVRLAPPVSRSRSSYPVIIFSHGMNAGSWSNSVILRDLASRGYVVAAITHTYWANATSFGEGEALTRSQSFVAMPFEDYSLMDLYMREGIDTLSEDQAFVARVLQEWNEDGAPGRPDLRGVFDLATLSVAGHSMGGMAADRSCGTYSAFRACISLDGAVWISLLAGRWPTPVDRPFMLLLSEQVDVSDPALALRYLSDYVDPQIGVVDGARHASFTDLPILNGEGDAAALMILQTTLNLMDGFLSAAAAHAPFSLNDPPVTGVTPLDLPALLATDAPTDPGAADLP